MGSHRLAPNSSRASSTLFTFQRHTETQSEAETLQESILPCTHPPTHLVPLLLRRGLDSRGGVWPREQRLSEHDAFEQSSQTRKVEGTEAERPAPLKKAWPLISAMSARVFTEGSRHLLMRSTASGESY